VPSALVSQAGQGVPGTGIRGQRAAPIDLGGAVPQTAVILAVTRNFSSTLLNFAAHSPEDTNATENTVIWSPNPGVLAAAAAGVLCAFCCLVDALPRRRLRRRPVQTSLSLLFLELNGYYVNAVRGHVNAADVLVSRGMDRDDSR
jgi:hypothetical protein